MGMSEGDAPCGAFGMPGEPIGPIVTVRLDLDDGGIPSIPFRAFSFLFIFC